jgi:nucleoside-diphosphate-sugar epimerase
MPCRRSPPACGSTCGPGRQAGPGENPYLDITRLTRDTGFAPAFDVAAAVADYAAWRADNPR